MTRKCVLCKETNYKNVYSFFSAPKDPELRKKWQKAIGIENYSVTDETYVCSKHFDKNDIITHWVSGVPPHVITIKYKKCRLRPGAIPGRDYHLQSKTDDGEDSNDSDVNTNDHSSGKLKKVNLMEEAEELSITKTESKLQVDNNENRRITVLGSLHRQSSNEFNDLCKKRKDCSKTNKSLLIKTELSENGSNVVSVKQSKENKTAYMREDSLDSKTDLIRDMNSEDENGPNQLCRDSPLNKSKKILESSELFNISNGGKTSIQYWESKLRKDNNSSKERSVDNSEVNENVYIRNEMVDSVNCGELDAYSSLYNDTEDSEMLFEDLLEVCTEVLLPRGWSCLVASKGLTTTIVYLYMGMTKGGLPFTEKQVFIKSDMLLHCIAVNREINPFLHNLIKEGKNLKVQSLLDIEELIDEFDQRTICQGIYNTEGSHDVRDIKTACRDGIKWRHVLCSLIVNNDSSVCTKCATLSRVLQRKLKGSHSSFSTSTVFTNKQEKAYILRQKCKRIMKHDHRYESKSV